jgi:uncharacterized membrane protein YdjX (TVP38/TMEM64 family)
MFTNKSISIVLTILALITTWMYRAPLIASLQWFSDLDAVTASIRGYGLWGPAILFVLFILQTFIAFIPGQALMVASGFVYGFTGGTLITWISLVVGGQAAFWLARYYGRPFAEKWVSAPVLDRWDRSSAGQGIGFYVVTLVMPFFPNDAMCYVAGLGNMTGRRFLIANIIGRGIASLLTVIVGAYSKQIPGLLWIAVIFFIVLGIIGWIAARKYAKV